MHSNIGITAQYDCCNDEWNVLYDMNLNGELYYKCNSRGSLWIENGNVLHCAHVNIVGKYQQKEIITKSGCKNINTCHSKKTFNCFPLSLLV